MARRDSQVQQRVQQPMRLRTPSHGRRFRSTRCREFVPRREMRSAAATRWKQCTMQDPILWSRPELPAWSRSGPTGHIGSHTAHKYSNAEAVTPEAVTPEAVLVAGAPRAWSWAVVEVIEDGFVYFHQVSAREAAQHGSLVAPLPRSA